MDDTKIVLILNENAIMFLSEPRFVSMWIAGLSDTLFADVVLLFCQFVKQATRCSFLLITVILAIFSFAAVTLLLHDDDHHHAFVFTLSSAPFLKNKR
jgi:hypothetical protein